MQGGRDIRWLRERPPVGRNPLRGFCRHLSWMQRITQRLTSTLK